MSACLLKTWSLKRKAEGPKSLRERTGIRDILWHSKLTVVGTEAGCVLMC